ncbi:MAG: hypothetical protein LBM95_03185 [Lactobacillales bacterium]|nr:hypothetical protein [Lactobacillales bacterium]
MAVHKVAGTIILNEETGRNKFLIQHDQTVSEKFAVTDIEEGYTALGSLLSFFKEELELDLKNLSLIELTNVKVASVNLPFFVFEGNEGELTTNLPEDYSWEFADKLSHVFQRFEIDGVPYF